MASEKLIELINKLPLFEEVCINISLRVKYLNAIYCGGKKDVSVDYYDAYYGIIEILIYDLFHFLGVLCDESNCKALGLRRIINLYNMVKNELQNLWIVNDFSYFQNSKNYKKLPININIFKSIDADIMQIKSNIINNNAYKNIGNVRNKMTAHFEIDFSNDLPRLFNFGDYSVMLKDVFALFKEIECFLKCLYKVISGCNYNIDSILCRQSKMAIEFAKLIPWLNG